MRTPITAEPAVVVSSIRGIQTSTRSDLKRTSVRRNATRGFPSPRVERLIRRAGTPDAVTRNRPSDYIYDGTMSLGGRPSGRAG